MCICMFMLSFSVNSAGIGRHDALSLCEMHAGTMAPFVDLDTALLCAA